MTIKTIVSAAVLSGLVFSASAGVTLADGVQSFKPGHGISFDAGDEHAVGYFSNKAGKCQLVVTLAGKPNWDNGSLQITRYETLVLRGSRSARK